LRAQTGGRSGHVSEWGLQIRRAGDYPGLVQILPHSPLGGLSLCGTLPLTLRPAMTVSTVNLGLRECGDCPIRHRAVCSNCAPDELSRLDQIKYYRSYEAGQTVVWAGDKMAFVGSVVTGMASLSRAMDDGRTQMVGLLFPSDFVGRPGRDTAPFSVVATTDLVMCCFRKKPFETVMAETPHIAERLLQMTLDELDAAREWMVVLGRKTAREKIASLLAMIAKKSATLVGRSAGPNTAFELMLTREAMADFLGLTLETVSRQMSALKDEGIIVLDGKRQILVKDMQRLIATSGEDA
jgi:CRP/FNR family transcriptional regulator